METFPQSELLVSGLAGEVRTQTVGWWWLGIVGMSLSSQCWLILCPQLRREAGGGCLDRVGNPPSAPDGACGWIYRFPSPHGSLWAIIVITQGHVTICHAFYRSYLPLLGILCHVFEHLFCDWHLFNPKCSNFSLSYNSTRWDGRERKGWFPLSSLPCQVSHCLICSTSSLITVVPSLWVLTPLGSSDRYLAYQKFTLRSIAVAKLEL